MDDVREILKLAVDKERFRKAAYLEAAEKTTNALAKATFASLAAEEDKHERYLTSYYEKQVANEGWPAPAELGVEDDTMATVREIFKQATAQIGTAGEASAELTAVYEAGIAAEGESVEYYSDALAHATDPNAKAFFDILVRAEKMHLKLLSDTFDYLNDSGKWYLDEEEWIVEG
jgi:rubrerythrin